MPWKKATTMSLRLEFVHLAWQPGSNVSALCRRFGISRKTGHKWLRRFREAGEREDSLRDRSRRPRSSPRRTSGAVEEQVLRVREAHPAWGARKIKAYLSRQGHPHLPSASTIQFVLDKRKPKADTLLALGNPTSDLPFAEEEAQAIASLYGTTPLIGDQASEGELRAQAASYGLVHIAAHGSFDRYNPLFSTLHLAADAEHDGHLRVHEVYGLDLAQADLVVLSACDTQLGELSEGDDLIGLNRAFIYAGTPSLVASLWPVDDAATAELMERFYGHLREGYGKAESLRAAQLEMAEEKGASPAPSKGTAPVRSSRSPKRSPRSSARWNPESTWWSASPAQAAASRSSATARPTSTMPPARRRTRRRRSVAATASKPWNSR